MYEAGASIMVPRGLVIKPGGFVMQHFRFLIKWDGLLNPPVHHLRLPFNCPPNILSFGYYLIAKLNLFSRKARLYNNVHAKGTKAAALRLFSFLVTWHAGFMFE